MPIVMKLLVMKVIMELIAKVSDVDGDDIFDVLCDWGYSVRSVVWMGYSQSLSVDCGSVDWHQQNSFQVLQCIFLTEFGFVWQTLQNLDFDNGIHKFCMTIIMNMSTTIWRYPYHWK